MDMTRWPVESVTRRRFLGWASASSAFLAAHGLFAEEAPQIAQKSDAMEHRILSLELLCAVPLAAMREFYNRMLGLKVVEDLADRLTIAAGATQLTFRLAPAADGQPFYHFAFNIPENKIDSAWRWQKERTALLPIPARLRD